MPKGIAAGVRKFFEDKKRVVKPETPINAPRIPTTRLEKASETRRLEDRAILPELNSMERARLALTAKEFALECRGKSIDWVRQQIIQRTALRELNQKIGRKAFEPAFIAAAESGIADYITQWRRGLVASNVIEGFAKAPENAEIVRILGKDYFNQLIYEINLKAKRVVPAIPERPDAINTIHNWIRVVMMPKLEPITLENLKKYGSEGQSTPLSQSLRVFTEEELEELIEKFKRESQIFW